MTPSGEAKPSPARRGSETILVVEDESGVRELACEFLKVSGYRVVEAKDGIDALEIAKRHRGPIHLALIDMVMPKMSGRELADHLKRVRPETKVLFMSGYSEYTSGGADNAPSLTVLQKPFSISTLVERVCEAMEKPAVQKSSSEKVQVT